MKLKIPIKETGIRDKTKIQVEEAIFTFHKKIKYLF